MHSQRDSESGLGSDCIAETLDAYEYDFYQSYVPTLETEIRRHRNIDDDYDDPTIDLRNQEVALRPPSPVRKIPLRKSQHQQQDNRRQQQQIQQEKQLQKQSPESSSDTAIQELDFLMNEVRKRTYYGEKLITIMLNGLKETLGPTMYQEFASGKLPPQWHPIVRMNNDNCPYVEFLIKSDKSDHAPTQQLIGYGDVHLALSHVVVQTLQKVLINDKSSKPISSTNSSKHAPLHSTPIKNNPSKNKTFDPIAAKPASTKQVPPSSSASKRPLRPTPNLRGDSIGEQESRNDDLNDSRRIQPARKCRANQSSSSSRM